MSSMHFVRLGFQKTLKNRSRRFSTSSTSTFPSRFESTLNFSRPAIESNECNLRRSFVQISAMDEDLANVPSFDNWDDSEGTSGRNSNFLTSSDGEDSDTEFLVIPSTEVDLPHISSHVDRSDAVTAAAYQFAGLRRRRRKVGIQPGVFINMGLIAFLVALLLFVDWCSWKIVRLPLPSFYLTRPFLISAFLASFAGFFFVPLLDSLKVHQTIRKEGPSKHTSKRGTPTMGGLFFIPIGITVAMVIVGSSSVEVYGAAAATFAFAAIGLLDDILSFIRNHNYGLSAQTKLFLLLMWAMIQNLQKRTTYWQTFVVVGACFSFWLGTANVSSPYSMKMLVPLPLLGLVHLGKFYSFLTAFCFAAMGNGINLTDGLDGLAGGTAALAFIGMSIAILPISSDLAVFGASMAGACVGFLLHNGYKASVFMGDTGSLALGGALAAMAACTGMFFPLFIASGIFVLEVSSVIMQVSFFKATKSMYGSGLRLFRMAPLHHHFELCGMKEPLIVASAYIASSFLAILAGYVGLISV